jgi:uncharacterized phage-associated protein
MPTSQIVSAHDAARELRQRKPSAGRTQVMKWLYIAQGLHLAWFGEPLFAEDIQAWENGPVVSDYWHDLKENRPEPPAALLDERMLATLDSVLEFWGDMTGQELSRMTHTDGGPWCQVTESLDEFSPRSPLITHQAMRDWFSGHPVTRYRAEQESDAVGWSLVPDAEAPGLRAAVEQAIAGEVIRQSWPT